MTTTRYKVLKFPDARLRRRAAEVETFDAELGAVVDRLFETMKYERGIGLAAPQVGISQRIVVIDVSADQDAPLCLVNPRIVAREGVAEMEEGCLSVPDFRANVKRARRITVEARDQGGAPLRFDADELLSVCVQHEIDHLDGRLFIDHLSPLKRRRFLDALKRAKPPPPARRSEGARRRYLEQWSGERAAERVLS